MSGQIQQLREDLRRLEKVLQEMGLVEGDYLQHRGKILEPDLTSTTWHGELASDFQQFREGELISRYDEIPNEQLQRVIEELERKIEEIKQRIARLKASSAS